MFIAATSVRVGQEFQEWGASEADADRRGRPYTVFTAETAEHAERVIRENCRVTTLE